MPKTRGTIRTKWARARARNAEVETDREARVAWKRGMWKAWGAAGLWGPFDEWRRPGPGGWQKPYWHPDIHPGWRYARWSEARMRPDWRKHWKRHRRALRRFKDGLRNAG